MERSDCDQAPTNILITAAICRLLAFQFARGYFSPYFVTDTERMITEYENCKLLLVDKKIKNARDIIGILEEAIKGGFPLLIVAEDVEQEALATLVVNKLRGALRIVAIKAPGFGERKSQYLDDIAIMTNGTVRRRVPHRARQAHVTHPTVSPPIPLLPRSSAMTSASPWIRLAPKSSALRPR